MDANHTTPAPWAQVLSGLRDSTGVDMTFGGTAESNAMRLDHFVGARTNALRGLLVQTGSGVGGRVLQDHRTVTVADYSTAPDISHDYDVPVGAEHLRTVVGAPVVVGREVRGVIYAGTRGTTSSGDRLTDATVRAASTLAGHLAMEDEVERRVAHRCVEEHRAQTTLRQVQAELRVLRSEAADEEWANKLDRVSQLMAPAQATRTVISPRQLDVLTLVAAGESYSTVGTRLGLSPQTVKSYMRDLLVELGVHSRHAAVVEARRRRLIA